jgi:hypothetical protein
MMKLMLIGTMALGVGFLVIQFYDWMHFVRDLGFTPSVNQFGATFFLLTPESRTANAAGATYHSFLHRGDGFMALTAETPEAAIAFEQEDVLRMYAEAGLVIVARVYSRNNRHWGALSRPCHDGSNQMFRARASA